MSELKLDGQAEQALNTMQATPLSPMDEALFKAWAAANQIKKPDDKSEGTDYRGVYKASGGLILPNGELHRIAKKTESEQKLKTILYQQMNDRIAKIVGDQKQQVAQAHKDERQDITHKQKLEQGAQELKRLPHDLKMKEHDTQKQHLSIEQQKLVNEGKKIDVLKVAVTPKVKPNAAAKTSKSTSK